MSKRFARDASNRDDGSGGSGDADDVGDNGMNSGEGMTDIFGSCTASTMILTKAKQAVMNQAV